MKKFCHLLCLLSLIPSIVIADVISDNPTFKAAREKLVEKYIAGQGITDPKVLAAMRSVPRHSFVPQRLASKAYADTALPIGASQTISQPYVVALMTESLKLTGNHRVLEIGTGSGYQAAVLAELCAEVYSIEIIPELTRHTRSLLAELGYANVHVKLGDGYRGWPGKTPFDGIIVTAAPDEVPEPRAEVRTRGSWPIARRGSSSTTGWTIRG